jgi:translation initiation factor 3 subunit I
MSAPGQGSSLPRVNTAFLPILLKGHERSITTVKYGQDGDLIFTAAKDNTPTVWYAETGERLGTYGYHRGAVLDIDPSWDSKHVLTACADGSARLFNASTGDYLARMPHKGAVRACAWGDSTRNFATAADPFHSRERGCINIYSFPQDNELEQAPNPSQDPAPLHLPMHEIQVDDNDKAVCIGWTIADQHIIAGFDSGVIVKYDAETAQEVARNTKIHVDRVNRLTFNRDKTLFVTASKDCYAKLVDPNNLEVIKEYRTANPVNGAAISPTHPHVLVGGGQDAQSVTTTAASSGKFESRFFHMIYAEEFGRVKGHFGPINCIAVHPFGRSFASGSEDGFIRVHRFEPSYLNTPDLIPHDLKK